MKKTFVYIVVALLVGLMGGWLIFGDAANGSEAVHEESMAGHSHDAEDGNQMWTCSMHPQVMQPEPGACPLCGMDLIPADTEDMGLAPNEIRMTENAMALADIRTTIVGNAEASAQSGITLSGEIRTNEEAEAVQSSYFDGRIEQLNVNYEGQEVRKGQVLATLYAPSLVAAQQELLTAAALKESQPALYAAVRKKLKLWKLSDDQIGRIESSGKITEYFPIFATVSGTVSAKLAAEGDYVQQGQPLLKVADLSTVWAEFDAYESQITQLTRGQEISIRTNAYPNKEFAAKISFIDPVLDSGTRTLRVRATLKNEGGLLKPGMFITGSLSTDKGNGDELGASSDQKTVSIPATAVLWTGERSVVYVRTNPNMPVFEMRQVTLGAEQGEMVTILGGLQQGEAVVTHGAFTIDAAAQLQGKKSMMSDGGRVQTGHEHQGMGAMESSGQEPAPEALKAAYPEIIGSYMKLKDALVASDAVTASKAVTQLVTLLPSSENGWERPIKQSLKKMRDALGKMSDSGESLNALRKYFTDLSDALIALGSLPAGQDIYVQFCPMANGNTGGYWMSEQEEIRNPYFGDAMLNCGEVRETRIAAGK